MINNLYLNRFVKDILIWRTPSFMNFINEGVRKNFRNRYYASGGDIVGSLGALDATTNLDVPPAVRVGFISGNALCLP